MGSLRLRNQGLETSVAHHHHHRHQLHGLGSLIWMRLPLSLLYIPLQNAIAHLQSLAHHQGLVPPTVASIMCHL